MQLDRVAVMDGSRGLSVHGRAEFNRRRLATQDPHSRHGNGNPHAIILVGTGSFVATRRYARHLSPWVETHGYRP